jgi:hypothetical protein
MDSGDALGGWQWVDQNSTQVKKFTLSYWPDQKTLQLVRTIIIMISLLSLSLRTIISKWRGNGSGERGDAR